VSRACFLVLALALGACGAAGPWVKPGADAKATDLAYRQCRALAATSTDTAAAIDKDILATRGNDWQRAGVMRVETREMHEQARAHGDAVIASCMRAKGFSRPPPR
jgi:hypothetical protein